MIAENDDVLDIVEDDEGRPASGPAWRILVTDDDPMVHETTTMALKGEKIAGRHLDLLHAASASEARGILEVDAAIHLILLDVVMETEDAGLRLVPVIRKELGREKMRIVIRTGQPGYAPEREVWSSYEIDGYLVKSQLTHAKLMAMLETLLGSDRSGAVH